MPKQKKQKHPETRKPVDMREGKPALNAFERSMLQILNPLPKKKRA